MAAIAWTARGSDPCVRFVTASNPPSPHARPHLQRTRASLDIRRQQNGMKQAVAAAPKPSESCTDNVTKSEPLAPGTHSISAPNETQQPRHEFGTYRSLYCRADGRRRYRSATAARPCRFEGSSRADGSPPISSSLRAGTVPTRWQCCADYRLGNLTPPARSRPVARSGRSRLVPVRTS